jgi:hypothetical protein
LIYALVGVTFAVAIPCILAAFEIQNMQNTGKKGWQKITEKRNERKPKKDEDNDIPDFLK